MVDNKEVQSTAIDLRKQIVRQQRIKIEYLNAFLKLGQEEFEIIDCTSFGLAVYSPRPFDANFETESATFIVDNITTQQISLKTIRQETNSDSRHIVAFEIKGIPLDIGRVAVAHYAAEAIDQFRINNGVLEALPRKFRHLTLELKENLSRFKRCVDDLERKLTFSSLEAESSAEQSAAILICHYIKSYLEPQLAEIASVVLQENDKLRLDCYSFFRDHISSILNEAPFSDRSLNKPLGYAGDFDMMNMIYNNELLGKSLFAKSIHKYMVNMSGGQAVRNRAVYLKEKIHLCLARSNSKEPVKILSVASGPAMEIQLLAKDDKKNGSRELINKIANLEFHFLDQDLSSLHHAQKQIKTTFIQAGISPKLNFTQMNIKSLIGRGLTEDNFDLIYSAGLFDYFSDPVAIHTAKQLYKALKPGGQLIIGNFDVSNPSKFFMELAWDWHLIYRSGEDLNRMFGEIGTTSSLEYETEKVNLFYIINK